MSANEKSAQSPNSGIPSPRHEPLGLLAWLQPLGELLYGLAKLLAGLSYVRVDRTRVLIHAKFSLTLRTVCPGTGGPAARSRSTPARASTAPAAA